MPSAHAVFFYGDFSMSNAAPAPSLPAHVAADRVHPYPLVLGASTEENPFDELIPKLHEGPDVIYALHVYPGGGSGWVFRRAADLRAIYMDTEHFSSKDFAPFAK